VAANWSKSDTDRWERGFTALCKFRAREGHCCPSRQHVERNFKLGDWVSVQRYRKEFLPIERKRLLDKIGFVWNTRDQLWERNFTALLKFKPAGVSLLRPDPLRHWRSQTWLVGCDAAPE
jgi:hypothetical protein